MSTIGLAEILVILVLFGLIAAFVVGLIVVVMLASKRR